MSNLVVRVLTTLLLLPAVLYLVHLGGWPVFTFFFIGGSVALWEYASIVSDDKKANVVFMLLSMTTMASFMKLPAGHSILVLQAAGVLFAIFFTLRTGDMKSTWIRLSTLGFGFFYISLNVSFFFKLREAGETTPNMLPATWIYLALIASWGNDTCAYFAGRFFGKHKFYPKVSPKKTWEGAIGGAIGGIFLMFVLKFVAPNDWFAGLTVADILLIGIPAAVVSPLGDLAESLLKRTFDTKDAGGFLPGHGGILDRIDATFFVVAWLLPYVTVIRPFLFGAT
ncbi:MAG: phosphatidate cytidylyltransferase [Deltaproteobacteria bacterium]|nr:phosphatidate cytidylyltransferase [Deltaproteobacteria bacterium]